MYNHHLSEFSANINCCTIRLLHCAFSTVFHLERSLHWHIPCSLGGALDFHASWRIQITPLTRTLDKIGRVRFFFLPFRRDSRRLITTIWLHSTRGSSLAALSIFGSLLSMPNLYPGRKISRLSSWTDFIPPLSFHCSLLILRFIFKLYPRRKMNW